MSARLTREDIKRSIKKHLTVLNRLEPHLGCALCHGPLVDGRCPTCQPTDTRQSARRRPS